MIPRYSRPELAALWEDKYRFELWLDIELAACQAMERAGTVPAGTAARVRAAAAGQLDPATAERQFVLSGAGGGGGVRPIPIPIAARTSVERVAPAPC